MVIKNTMNIFLLSTCILMALLGSNIITVQGDDCNSFLGTVSPCKDFILGFAAQPSGECCGNLQGLDKKAKGSEADRKAICQCMKEGLKLFPVNPQKLKQLTQICLLSNALPTDPNVDCNSI